MRATRRWGATDARPARGTVPAVALLVVAVLRAIVPLLVVTALSAVVVLGVAVLVLVPRRTVAGA
ncbi:hypothetical protein GCM10023334_042990 [Nonomuraea thailandensis]